MTKRQSNIYNAIKEGCRDAELFWLDSSAEEFKREFRSQYYLASKNELTTISQLSYLFHLYENLYEVIEDYEEIDELLSLNFSDIES